MSGWHCFYVFANFFVLLSRRQVKYSEGGSCGRSRLPADKRVTGKRGVVFGDVAVTAVILPLPAAADLVKLKKVQKVYFFVFCFFSNCAV